MFKKVHLLLLGICAIGMLSSDELYYSYYVPVLMKRTELEKSIAVMEPRELSNPGKIYIKSDTLYIVEKYKGVHVILNSDPANPEIKHFIRIPGVVDVAVKGSVLFADNAVDLVSVDMSNLPEISVLDRKMEVFPELTPPDYTYVPYQFSQDYRPENTVIVEWKTMKE